MDRMIPGGFSTLDDFEKFVARCRKSGLTKVAVGAGEQRLEMEFGEEFAADPESTADPEGFEKMTMDQLMEKDLEDGSDTEVDAYDDPDLFPGNQPYEPDGVIVDVA